MFAHKNLRMSSAALLPLNMLVYDSNAKEVTGIACHIDRKLSYNIEGGKSNVISLFSAIPSLSTASNISFVLLHTIGKANPSGFHLLDDGGGSDLLVLVQLRHWSRLNNPNPTCAPTYTSGKEFVKNMEKEKVNSGTSTTVKAQQDPRATGSDTRPPDDHKTKQRSTPKSTQEQR